MNKFVLVVAFTVPATGMFSQSVKQDEAPADLAYLRAQIDQSVRWYRVFTVGASGPPPVFQTPVIH